MICHLFGQSNKKNILKTHSISSENITRTHMHTPNWYVKCVKHIMNSTTITTTIPTKHNKCEIWATKTDFQQIECPLIKCTKFERNMFAICICVVRNTNQISFVLKSRRLDGFLIILVLVGWIFFRFLHDLHGMRSMWVCSVCVLRWKLWPIDFHSNFSSVAMPVFNILRLRCDKFQ